MSLKKEIVATIRYHHYVRVGDNNPPVNLQHKTKKNPSDLVSFPSSFRTIISVVVLIFVFALNNYFFGNSDSKIDNMIIFWGVKAFRPEILKSKHINRSIFSVVKETGGSIFRNNDHDRCITCSIKAQYQNDNFIYSQGFFGGRKRDGYNMGIRMLCRRSDHIDDSIGEEFEKRVLIAVGSNMGNRYENIMTSLQLLEPLGVKTLKTSFLHETVPMYVTNQPQFLNGVIEIKTKKSPVQLLKTLKEVEEQLGKILKPNKQNDSENHNEHIREYQPNGPRPIDLDILFYDIHDHHSIDANHEKDLLQENQKQHSGGIVINDENIDLIIPHPRIEERDFVLYPLADLYPNFMHPVTNMTVYYMKKSLQQPKSTKPVRIIPIPRNRMLCFNHTLVMGILNVTPDSFSGDGVYKNIIDEDDKNNDIRRKKFAVEQALQMQKDGADIIDIGGESTRPGAEEVCIQEEIKRTVPVIQELRKVSDIPISIDTRHAAVAKAAIEAGADIVNDVSGGMYDPNMILLVSEYTNVPFVMMHSRGTPQTMSRMTNYSDDGVVSHVADHLQGLSEKATLAGIPRWLHIVDPGIGFAKEFQHNLELLKYGTAAIHQRTNGCTILLGPSRKRFIGQVMTSSVANGDLPAANERDSGTIAACIMGSLHQCKDSNSPQNLDDRSNMIFRVHNVKAMKQATSVMDAIQDM